MKQEQTSLTGEELADTSPICLRIRSRIASSSNVAGGYMPSRSNGEGQAGSFLSRAGRLFIG